MLALFDPERPNSAGKRGEWRIPRGSAPPPSQGDDAPALTKFGGSFLFMHTPSDTERPNMTW